MKIVFGILNTCSTEEPRFCYVDSLKGKGMSREVSDLFTTGKRAAKVYPPDAYAEMSDRFGGKVLGDFVCNIWNVLIVHRRVKEVFERVNQAETEYLPLRINNRKGKLASEEYFVVNPIGTYDVLDQKKSKLGWDELGLQRVNKFVLDRKKAAGAPDLFRLKGLPTSYVITLNMATELKKLKPENTNRHYLDILEL